MSVDDVRRMIDRNIEVPDLGILGDPGVNVVLLNLALDGATAERK
jgi:K+-transporting ATPase c subunit